ncbi:hypothetical protein Agub_g14748 [Astrephomene gubernaculifera]|uniref:RING-type E3 ubiquitin transferase n=1 Tax=Astrephomene gubernaculifera TaxID=47775 RepID=A0AAD3E4E3_9CHLO|nr:hypothetical protein Agub_g14748 [Astrephomene gubernaculifera]
MAVASPPKAMLSEEEAEKRRKIADIQKDTTLTDAEKARRIQELHTARWTVQAATAEEDPFKELPPEEKDRITCHLCCDTLEKPVTLPCQHNLCLGCLKNLRKLDAKHRNCPFCRKDIPTSFIDNARINMSMVGYIRSLKARCAGSSTRRVEVARMHREEEEDDRPEEAYVTERAKKTGMANACSGKLKMTCPPDHFGPIGPEFDPKGNRGVVVGDMFPNRMACRMWNVHLPHVAGIAGQGSRGAQSVVLSGGYTDDVDEGEYFLYTGSGGKDLSGNKRNGEHSKDQEFTRYNLALKVSCEKGLPVRVVRSSKEKRSAYAPKADAKEADEVKDSDEQQDSEEEEEVEIEQEEEDEEEDEEEEEEASGSKGKDKEKGKGKLSEDKAVALAKTYNPVRYDGIYRILACWRCPGEKKFLVCRYLFERCDNAPAPWSAGDEGDEPRGFPEFAKKEVAQAEELGEVVTRMGDKPYWDYDPVSKQWGWTRPLPAGRAAKPAKQPRTPAQLLEQAEKEVKRLEKEVTKNYGCLLCHTVTERPVLTPVCQHRFCLECLKSKVESPAGKPRLNARPSRSCTSHKYCPAPRCNKDLKDFMSVAQVNHDMAGQAREKLAELRAKRAEVEALRRQISGEAEPAEGVEAEAMEVAEPAAAEPPAAAAAAAPSEGGEPPSQPGQAHEAGVVAQVEADTAAGKEAAVGPGAPATAAAEGAGRWASEAAALALQLPEFDAALIQGLLEDQGGDVEEVRAALKRMKRNEQRANTSPRKQGGRAAGKRGAAKRGRGRGAATKPAAAAEEGDADVDGEEEEEVKEAVVEKEDDKVPRKTTKGKGAVTKRQKLAA